MKSELMEIRLRKKLNRTDEASLHQVPGIGKSLAKDLNSIGIGTVSGLKSRSPEKLFEKLQAKHGKVDRCVLYAFRCAVYYAEGGRNKEKLKWWNWKDAT